MIGKIIPYTKNSAVNAKTMSNTGDGVFKICDNHNTIYIYKNYRGGDSMAMAAVANGC